MYIALLGPTGQILSHGVLWMPMGSETPTDRLGGVYWMDRLDIFEIPVSSLAGTGFSAEGVAAAVPDGFGKFQMVRNEPDRPMSLDLAPPYGDDWDILVLGGIQATTEARGTWYVQDIRGRVRIGDVIIIHEDKVPSKLEAYYRQVTWSSS